MQLICAAWNEELKSVSSDALVAPLGIGYLEAALELTRILNERNDIDEIIFLGTCGSYNSELKIGDVVAVSSVQLLERGEVLGLAYKVREGISFESGLEGVPCLCSLEITNSSELSMQILKHYGFESAVENMELYGVARVASERGIKWSARLGVTNHTNIEAHQDWLSNHQDLSQKLGEWTLGNQLN